jgi:hypothetical protein
MEITVPKETNYLLRPVNEAEGDRIQGYLDRVPRDVAFEAS